MLKSLKQKEAALSKKRRFRKTLEFVSQTLPAGSDILDIGTPNELSKFMATNGYKVRNTPEKDLDFHPEIVRMDESFDAATAFEIFEHLINPMGVLQQIPCKRLYASIPMRLWFSKAYRNKHNEWDQHYHEFEDWQFDWLLKKSGWKVVRREKWTNPALIPGFRPVLRTITPRYYIIEAVRTQD